MRQPPCRHFHFDTARTCKTHGADTGVVDTYAACVAAAAWVERVCHDRASGPAASSRVSNGLGRVGSPVALSPRAASDSGVEVSAALGDMEAPRTTGVVEPLTAEFGRTARSAMLPPDLRVRLPALQDACSTAVSESG